MLLGKLPSILAPLARVRLERAAPEVAAEHEHEANVCVARKRIAHKDNAPWPRPAVAARARQLLAALGRTHLGRAHPSESPRRA
eukprot:1480671-Prymnesium_polylepis.1